MPFSSQPFGSVPFGSLPAGVAGSAIVPAVDPDASSQNLFLLEITAGQAFTGWVLETGAVYSVPIRLISPTGPSLNFIVVRENFSTILVRVASIEACRLNAGSWFSDGSFVYVRPSAGLVGGIWAQTYQGIAQFLFGDVAQTVNDQFYDPRIKSTPRLSLRIEPRFSGISQIGGGNCTLINADGFFDALDDLQWDAGTATFRQGINIGTINAPYAGAYQTLGTWNIESWDIDDEKFTLKLKERKNNLQTKIPIDVYTREEFPAMRREDIGKPIPIAYGRNYGVKPMLIDPTLYKFKVAGHAIGGFFEIRIQRTLEHTIDLVPETWVLQAANVYRTAAAETVKNVLFNTTDLVEVNSIETVASTDGSWHQRNNQLYIHPPTAETITSGIYTVTKAGNTQTWQTANFATTDKSRAEFTLGSDYDGQAAVSVDFIGKSVAGVAIENCADIVRDILGLIGETDIDAASFTAAHDYFTIGIDAFGAPVYVLRPSLYLDKADAAGNAIAKINEVCGTSLYVDYAGLWHFEAFDVTDGSATVPGSTIREIFTQLDFTSFLKSTANDKLASKLVLTYAKREADGWGELLELEQLPNQHLHNRLAPVLIEKTIALWNIRDVRYFAERFLNTDGQPLRELRTSIPWQAFVLVPGQKIKLTYARRHNVSAVFEVLEVAHDLQKRLVTLVLGNLRSWGDTFGFWSSDAQADWDPGWGIDEKIIAREESGYWTDDNQMIGSTDPASANLSRWW